MNHIPTLPFDTCTKRLVNHCSEYCHTINYISINKKMMELDHIAAQSFDTCTKRLVNHCSEYWYIGSTTLKSLTQKYMMAPR